MPNWVKNNVNVYGTKKQLEKFVEKHFNKEGEFDFNTIIKMPKKVFRGNVGQAERKKYGENNWYDWSVKNWGTKWNACDTDEPIIEDRHPFLKESVLSFSFNTAWSVPLEIYEKLAKMYKKNPIVVKYADEDIGVNCGAIDVSDGDVTIDYVETREFALEVWGYDEDEQEEYLEATGE